MKTVPIYAMTLMFTLLCTPAPSGASAVDELLAQYRSQGATGFDPGAGKAIWNSSTRDGTTGQLRSCTDCHGRDLRSPGKHVKTGKVIEPLAPSANSKRLTETEFIEKWLKRNCEWTLGRICTPVEKGGILLFLKSQ